MKRTNGGSGPDPIGKRTGDEGPRSDRATPLILLVGFLGSGKTTQLKWLIDEALARGLEPSVILNDYGNADVDVKDLQSQVKDVLPITGSCVCCSSQFDLLAALANFRHHQSSVLFLEANGTTDSAALLLMLADSPSLTSFEAPTQISVIDAKRWATRTHGKLIEPHQVRTASHAVVSYQDRVSPVRMRWVLDAVQAINPGIVFTTPHRFFEMRMPSTRSLATWPLEPAGHGGHHFSALVLELPHPVCEVAFLEALRGLPTQVLRAKGFVRFISEPTSVRMFQVVAGEPDVSPHPMSRQDLEGTLVMVGPNLDADAIRGSLQRLTNGIGL